MRKNPNVEEWIEKLPPDLQAVTRALIAAA